MKIQCLHVLIYDRFALSVTHFLPNTSMYDLFDTCVNALTMLVYVDKEKHLDAVIHDVKCV